MDLGEKLQVAEVLIGTLSLFVSSLSACLTWHAVKGNDVTLAQARRWDQHMQVLPRYHPRALRATNARHATVPALTRCLIAFATRMTAGFMS
jgi:hypothetical protein